MQKNCFSLLLKHLAHLYTYGVTSMISKLSLSIIDLTNILWNIMESLPFLKKCYLQAINSCSIFFILKTQIFNLISITVYSHYSNNIKPT